jgi:hypothetical protein
MRISLLVPAILLVLSTAAIAQQKDQDEQPTNKKEAAATAAPTSSETQILLDELIDELGSPRFTIRIQAARKLKAAGEQAIEALSRVTQTGTRETASQALQILKEHLENKNNSVLQIAAKKALEQISADDKNPSSSAAKGILNNEANAQSTQNPQARRLMIRPGNLKAAAMRVQFQNNNGKIRIQVEKNGQKTAITEDKDGIKVEKKDANGKLTTKTYKNVDEMKMKDKEAHQIFQQYKKVGGGIQIQLGNGIPLQLKNAQPKIPNQNPATPKGGAPQNLQNMQLQMLKRHRDLMESQLRKMQENIKNNVPKEHRKQLEDQLKIQIEIMNRPLLELEQKLNLNKPPQTEEKPETQPEVPTPTDKEPAKEEPADGDKNPIEPEPEVVATETIDT